MEGILLGIAYAAFVLAACSAIAAVVIFIKLDVPDAIRFLRHKPLKHQGGSSKARQSSKRSAFKGSSVQKQAKRPTRSTEEVVEKAERASEERKAHAPQDKGATGPTVIEGAASGSGPSSASMSVPEEPERPTDLLIEDETERPTGLLQEETERETSILEEEATERPTGLLIEEEDTERPTGLLGEDAERPTSVLEERPTSTESLRSTFRFVIKQKVVSVNTDEEI